MPIITLAPDGTITLPVELRDSLSSSGSAMVPSGERVMIGMGDKARVPGPETYPGPGS